MAAEEVAGREELTGPEELRQEHVVEAHAARPAITEDTAESTESNPERACV
uniref:Uncharacterized protein n=1 Tax=Arundo donax TaxID=35708 RepID=A0A0A8ZT52_ARUDO